VKYVPVYETCLSMNLYIVQTNALSLRKTCTRIYAHHARNSDNRLMLAEIECAALARSALGPLIFWPIPMRAAKSASRHVAQVHRVSKGRRLSAPLKTRLAHARSKQVMETLPIELVDIILRSAGALVRPILARVCAKWRDMLRVPRKKRFHENRSYRRRFTTPGVYSHKCTSPAMCATFYMSRLIDAGHWALLDWMVDTFVCLKGAMERGDGTQEYVCAQLASRGDLARLCAMIQKYRFRWDGVVLYAAARYGHLHVVEWAHTVAAYYSADICPGAARGGHMGILEWAVAKGLSMGVEVFKCAAKGGHLAVLKWLHGHRPFVWNQSITLDAAFKGDLHIVQWAMANAFACNIDDICDMGASGGHLPVIEWAMANGAVWDARLCASALRNGHCGVFEWLHAHDCPMDESACSAAAQTGNLRALQRLRAAGCPWSNDSTLYAAMRKQWDVLEWAIENGCPYDANRIAAVSGDLATIQRMRARGLELSESCSFWAISRGRLDTLEWLHATGRPIHPNICAHAAEERHLHVLQWAHRMGFKLDRMVCIEAAENGDLEMLQWARANGCPWDKRVCKRAAGRGHLHVLAWARANGCVMDKKTRGWASHNGHRNVVAWIDAENRKRA